LRASSMKPRAKIMTLKATTMIITNPAYKMTRTREMTMVVLDPKAPVRMGTKARSMTRAFRNYVIIRTTSLSQATTGEIAETRKATVLRTRMMISKIRITGLFHQMEGTIILESVINLTRIRTMMVEINTQMVEPRLLLRTLIIIQLGIT